MAASRLLQAWPEYQQVLDSKDEQSAPHDERFWAFWLVDAWMQEQGKAKAPGDAMQLLREYKELPATALFEALQGLLRELTNAGVLQGTEMREEALRLTLREFVQHCVEMQFQGLLEATELKSVKLTPLHPQEVLQAPLRSFSALLEELRSLSARLDLILRSTLGKEPAANREAYDELVARIRPLEGDVLYFSLDTGLSVAERQQVLNLYIEISLYDTDAFQKLVYSADKQAAAYLRNNNKIKAAFGTLVLRVYVAVAHAAARHAHGLGVVHSQRYAALIGIFSRLMELLLA